MAKSQIAMIAIRNDPNDPNDPNDCNDCSDCSDTALSPSKVNYDCLQPLVPDNEKKNWST